MVVGPLSKPEPIAKAFKSYATRKLKAENALVNPEQKGLVAGPKPQVSLERRKC
jgi:hypothetical protein